MVGLVAYVGKWSYVGGLGCNIMILYKTTVYSKMGIEREGVQKGLGFLGRR